MRGPRPEQFLLVLNREPLKIGLALGVAGFAIDFLPFVPVQRSEIFIPGLGQQDVRGFDGERFAVLESKLGGESRKNPANRRIAADVMKHNAADGPIP